MLTLYCISVQLSIAQFKLESRLWAGVLSDKWLEVAVDG